MEIISRTYYASKLDSWIGKGNIIVLVGSRRTGKSYVLKDFIQRHKDEEDTNIIYIDKEKRITKTSKAIQNSTNSSKPDGKKADITIS